MKKELDLTKPMQTRDGRKVELLTDNLSGDYPLVGLVTEADGSRLLIKVTREGRFSAFWTDDHPSDIINVTTRHVRYVNFDDDGSAFSFTSRHLADQAAKIADEVLGIPRRIACVRVEFEDGQFDE